MRRTKDLTGRIFGRWTVIRRTPHPTHATWLCRCSGTKKEPHRPRMKSVQQASLIKGRSMSCGCSQKGKSCPRLTHGASAAGEDRALYMVWLHMMRRCYNPTDRRYLRFGGKGIRVSWAWQNVLNFKKDLSPRPEGASLCRRNPGANYSKTNCFWGTASEASNHIKIRRTEDHD